MSGLEREAGISPASQAAGLEGMRAVGSLEAEIRAENAPAEDAGAIAAERLRAYIWPNRAQTEEEQAALARAVEAQLAYERGGDLAGLPMGTESFSIGNYSVTLREAASAALTQNNICPAAWAILYNAGLLRRRWPVAKRL